MNWFMGIDIGSRTSKAVLMREDKIAGQAILSTGTDYRQAGRKLREELLNRAGINSGDITYTLATGNSGATPFGNEDMSDIVCCARGMNHMSPSVRTVIDIEAQSSRAIRLSAGGRVINFVVSEKCAAGSGFFIDIIANVLRVDIGEVGPISLKSMRPASFSTACAVFGESEAISRVAEGTAREDILAGIHNCLAEKIFALVERVGKEDPIAICGGGALNVGLVKSLETRLSVSLHVPPQPQLVTALGAAVMARERSLA